MSDLEDLKKIAILIDSMKTLIGDNVFDKKLINKKTDDIYDYII